jgi:hypothetical protein
LASTGVTRLKKGGFVIHIRVHMAKKHFADRKIPPDAPIRGANQAEKQVS